MDEIIYTIFVVVLLSLLLGLCFYNAYKSIYSWFDHYGWEEDSIPNKKAKIQKIDSKVVRWGKSSKLKTKISFSDGFYFITYKTDYEYIDVLLWKLYISETTKKNIIDLAIKKHKIATNKFIKNN